MTGKSATKHPALNDFAKIPMLRNKGLIDLFVKLSICKYCININIIFI